MKHLCLKPVSNEYYGFYAEAGGIYSVYVHKGYAHIMYCKSKDGHRTYKNEVSIREEVLDEFFLPLDSLDEEYLFQVALENGVTIIESPKKFREMINIRVDKGKKK